MPTGEGQGVVCQAMEIRTRVKDGSWEREERHGGREERVHTRACAGFLGTRRCRAQTPGLRCRKENRKPLHTMLLSLDLILLAMKGH